jgi:hypothetical protein
MPAFAASTRRGSASSAATNQDAASVSPTGSAEVSESPSATTGPTVPSSFARRASARPAGSAVEAGALGAAPTQLTAPRTSATSTAAPPTASHDAGGTCRSRCMVER